MKLRNKKTGEIKPAEAREDGIYLYDETTEQWYKYELSLLAEWWEYYEEPSKTIWQIKDSGELQDFEEDDFSDGYIESSKSIGNYFDTREEAEKAVEKLKAWKRLKDKGFSFDPVDRYEALCGNGFNIPITATMPPEAYTDTEVSKDLDICFGGEQ